MSLTDADSRKMKGAHGEHFIGYNVPVAVDAKHDLIVAEDVVPAANDRQQLAPLARAAKAELQVETLTVVADKGYHQAEHVAACAAAGVSAYVPVPDTTSGQTKDGLAVFPKEQFRYDAGADVYHCPGGHALPFQQKNLNRGQERGLYYDRAACRSCALLKQCTTGSCRVIGQHAQEAAVEATAARVLADPAKVAARKEIVEHVFGTLRVWGHDKFLMRGIAKVKGEFSPSAGVYNLRRVLNLRRVPELLAAVRARPERPGAGGSLAAAGGCRVTGPPVGEACPAPEPPPGRAASGDATWAGGRRGGDQQREMPPGIGRNGFAVAGESEAGGQLVGDELEVGRVLERQEGLEELVGLCGPSRAVVAARAAGGEVCGLVPAGNPQAEEMGAADAQQLGSGEGVEGLTEELRGEAVGELAFFKRPSNRACARRASLLLFPLQHTLLKRSASLSVLASIHRPSRHSYSDRAHFALN